MSFDTGYVKGIEFKSSKYLELSIHLDDYQITGQKNTDNSWNISVYLTDTYDFAFAKKYDNFAISAINNFAYLYQQTCLLQPYEWEVSYTFTYKE